MLRSIMSSDVHNKNRAILNRIALFHLSVKGFTQNTWMLTQGKLWI